MAIIDKVQVGSSTYDISAKEANLQWGGKNFSGSFGVLDAALVPDLGANRMAFAAAAGVTIEYSTDGGSTWTDYGATNIQKTGLTACKSAQTFYLGKHSTAGSGTANDRLRITFDSKSAGVYTVLNKFIIYVSTNGATGCKCTIDAATNAAPTTFKTFADNVTLTGWSGYNVINTADICTYSNSSSQYQKLRFTFSQTGAASSGTSMIIYSIMGFGGVGWAAPSQMAKNGHIYSYDGQQNVTFPSNLKADYVESTWLRTSSASEVSSADKLAVIVDGWIYWISPSKFATADHTHANATTSAAGFMSKDDKSKLDGIASGANNYSLPTATSSVLGGVKIGSNITVSNGTISLSKSNVTSALGYTPLQSHQGVTNSAPTLAWGTTSTIGKVGDTALTVTMPANPNTNTHYTTGLYIGASNTKANAATTNGNTYIKLYDDSTKRSEFKIAGSGATTVSSDANGNITISSTDNNTNTAHSHSAGTGLSVSGSGGTSGTTTYSANLNSTTSLGTIGTTSKLYAVGVDANGKLCVAVPWTDTNTDTGVTSVSVTGTGNAITTASINGRALTLTKGSSFAASSHTHTKSQITDFPTVLTGGSQTTTSSADAGSNVFTFTKSDGTSSTLTVKNGSKGSTGPTGPTGTTPTIKAAAGSNIGSIGTPSVTASTSGTTTTFTFNYLKGAVGPVGPTGATGTGSVGPTGPTGYMGSVSATSAKFLVSGVTSSGSSTLYCNSSVYCSGSVLYGAAWNDYAEYREVEATVEPGRVVIETGKGDLVLATERLQPGAEVISDTYGFCIGETEKSKTPIAVTGRVLVYPLEDRDTFAAGDPVCAGPNGTVSRMTRDEVREYPDRIIGTVSEIPSYDTWGAGNIKVNNRIWIRIK